MIKVVKELLKDDYDGDIDLEIKLIEKNYNKNKKFINHNSKRNISKFLNNKRL